ncbi:MAG: ammonia channel protein, partial [Methylotenera sp.]|nr:ammonia channel protein [Methylotenera sp.]
MKKLLSMFALVSALGLGFTANTYADDAVPAADAAAVVVAPAAADAAAPAPAEAAPVAAAPAPLPNKGDTAWMLISTVLVTLMVIPGLALFYGGLVRQKNMLSVLMQTFMIFSLMGVLWAIYGYSVAFTGGNPFFGGLG